MWKEGRRRVNGTYIQVPEFSRQNKPEAKRHQQIIPTRKTTTKHPSVGLQASKSTPLALVRASFFHFAAFLIHFGPRERSRLSGTTKLHIQNTTQRDLMKREMKETKTLGGPEIARRISTVHY